MSRATEEQNRRLLRLADEPDIARPHSTVHQVLRPGRLFAASGPERPPVVRYEWPCPGNLLHMDVKKLGRFDAPGHTLTADRSSNPAGHSTSRREVPPLGTPLSRGPARACGLFEPRHVPRQA